MTKVVAKKEVARPVDRRIGAGRLALMSDQEIDAMFANAESIEELRAAVSAFAKMVREMESALLDIQRNV